MKFRSSDRVVWSEEVEHIHYRGHSLQVGGSDGDGYCYGHQSFDCFDSITDDEWAEINRLPFYESHQG